MKRLINGALWLIGVAVTLYVYFAVPLGERTLFQHTLRIAATAPAQDLGRELGEASGRLTEEARERGERALEELQAPPVEADAGPRPAD